MESGTKTDLGSGFFSDFSDFPDWCTTNQRHFVYDMKKKTRKNSVNVFLSFAFLTPKKPTLSSQEKNPGKYPVIRIISPNQNKTTRTKDPNAYFFRKAESVC